MLLTKYVLLSVFTVTLLGCGGSGKSNPSVPSQIINPAPHQEQYLLTASMAEPGEISSPGILAADQNVLVTVPDTMQVNLNATDHGRATLVLGSAQCYYQWATVNSTVVYQYFGGVSCVSGQQIQLQKTDAITLTLQTGYLSQNTQIQAVMNGTY